MTHHTTFAGGRSSRRAAAVLAGVAASGAIAVAAGLGSAPTANASCVSFWGIGNSADCTSKLFSAAIAIGPNAQAHASGLFGAAFALGDTALAYQQGAFTFGITAGKNSEAMSGGLFGIGVNLGANGFADAGYPGKSGAALFNLAVNIPAPGSDDTNTYAGDGIGNLAVALFHRSENGAVYETSADGNLNTAVNLAGTDTNPVGTPPQVVAGGSFVTTPGTLNTAFQIGGSDNVVLASPGPLAWAGSIFQNGATVTKKGPGIAINGLRIGGAAAVPSAASSHSVRPAAAASHSKR